MLRMRYLIEQLFLNKRAISRWLIFFLAGMIIIDLIAMLADCIQIKLYYLSLHGTEITRRMLIENEFRQNRVGLAQLGFLFMTAIFFLLWLYHAYKNLRLFKIEDTSFSPQWAVLSYFIPGLNFYLPYQSMCELWQASHSTALSRNEWKKVAVPRFILGWWLLFVIAMMVELFSWKIILKGETIHELSIHGAIWFVSNLFEIIAIVLLISVVRRINLQQREKFRRLSALENK